LVAYTLSQSAHSNSQSQSQCLGVEPEGGVETRGDSKIGVGADDGVGFWVVQGGLKPS